MKTDWLISGPSYTMISTKAEQQRSVNCVRQKVESGLGAGGFLLLRSPGLIAKPAPISETPGTWRGGFELNGLLYVLKHDTFYALDSQLQIVHQNGPVSDLTGSWVRMAHSFTAYMFVSDQILYRFSSDLSQMTVFTAADLPLTPGAFPRDIAFIDNYFVLIDTQLRLWWSTDDGQTWPGDQFEDIPTQYANIAIIEHLHVLYIYSNRAVLPFVVGSNPSAPFVVQESGVIVY